MTEDISDLAREAMLGVSQKSGMTHNPRIGPVMETSHHFQEQRAQAIANIPGGTAMLNRMSVDKNLSGVFHKLRTSEGKLPSKARETLDGRRVVKKTKDGKNAEKLGDELPPNADGITEDNVQKRSLTCESNPSTIEYSIRWPG